MIPASSAASSGRKPKNRLGSELAALQSGEVDRNPWLLLANLLHPDEHVRDLEIEGVGQLLDVHQGDIAHAALDAGEVGAVEFGF